MVMTQSLRLKLLNVFGQDKKRLKQRLREIRQKMEVLKKIPAKKEENQYETVNFTRTVHGLMSDPRIEGLINNSDINLEEQRPVPGLSGQREERSDHGEGDESELDFEP